MLPEQQQRILGYFIEEAKEHLTTIEQGLLNLQSTLNDPETLNEVFRAAHSVKGGAAMLGLSSIQRTAHRLEDCFKILKEQPVKVDQKLETLFLDVSDTLKALLENLQGPFGLTEEVANNLMSEAEPCFQLLHEHLDFLVKQGDQGISDPGKNGVVDSTATQQTKTPPAASESYGRQQLQTHVLKTLRQMLQLFKQTETAENRQQLQDCCQYLAELGEELDLVSWSALCLTAQAAIANPANSYLTLAKVVITSIKQALELVLADKETQIVPSEQLEALIGDIELFNLPAVQEDEEITPLVVTPQPNNSTSNINNIPEDTPVLELEHIEPQNNINDLSELFNQEDNSSDEKDLLPISKNIHVNGPQVGSAELNTLASLFADENPELDDNWQQENVLDINLDAEQIQVDTNNNKEENDLDLADFLSLEVSKNHNINLPKKAPEDLTLVQLFGDDLLEDNHQVPGKKDNSSKTDIDLDVDQNSVENLNDLVTPTSEELVAEDTKDVDDINEFLELVSQETIPSWETLSENNNSNFDNLFPDTNTNITEQESSDNKLLETNTPLVDIQNVSTGENNDLSSEEFVEDSLFDALSTPESDISLELDQKNIQNYNLNQEHKQAKNDLDGEIEQKDIAKSLEESLFAAAESGEIFGEYPLEDNTDSDSIQLDIEDVLGINDDLAALESTIFSEIEPEENNIQSQTTNDLAALESTIFSELEPEENNIQSQATNDLAELESTVFSEIEPELDTIYPQTTNDLAELESTIFSEIEPEKDSIQPQTTNDSSELESTIFSEIEPELDTIYPQTTNNLAELESTVFSEIEPEKDTIHPQAPNNLSELESTIFSELEPEKDTIHPQAPNNLSELESTIFSELEPEENNIQSQATNNLAELESTVFSEIEPEEKSEDVNDVSHIESVALPPPTKTEEVLPSSDIDSQKAMLPPATTQGANPSENFQIDSTDDGVDAAAGEVTQAFTEEQTVDSADFDELVAVTNRATDNIQVSSTSIPATTQEPETPENQTDEILENINATDEDDFADLEALINEDSASVSNDNVEAEFADLEALLDVDIPQETAPAATQGAGQQEVKSDTSEPVIDDTIANGFKDLEEMLKGSAPSQTADSPKRNSSSRVSRFEQLMKVPVKHLDDMSNLVGELVVNRNTLEQDQERLRQSLDNLLHQVQQLSDVGARMEELYEHSLLEASLLASRNKSSSGGDEETDRGFTELEIDRFTPFHTLSQEMIELIVRVRESSSDIEFVVEETEQVARQFRQVTTQLQEGLTRSRMEPFSVATDMLPRGVRDNAIKSGKQVKLNVQGRDTLIDKMILEHLGNPLNHLLNNAIAHGIETPEERIATGKPETGTINVSAFHQGNQTVISVSDDGAGINPDKVKAKALKMGLITPAEAQTLSATDTYELLFHPGFSTKDKADMLGGRGVGMDVVRTKIGEIRGMINIDSTIGKGTTFTIRLPLTLSICKALFCVSNKARIAFPMDGVEDTLDIHPKHVQYTPDGQAFIKWHDAKLPFKPLKELLTLNRQLSRGNVYGANRDDEMISAIVVRSANNLLALEVDQVLNEQEIAIKQFEGPAPKPIGVAGATVLGDGRIMPIADVLEIMDIFQGRTSKQSGVSSFWEQNSPPGDLEPVESKSDPTVLIVDDSITVRELLSLSFNKAGYRVEQARDGQEAWDKLRSGLPCDLVFCDIEMPRCDGLELLSRLQKDSDLQKLPIAMLTSRGADKHRQMAIQLGASGYFTKPYLEEALLEAASKMLDGEKLIGAA
ncbi:MAG: response regulator [Calothrix sp. MO_167.B12]|nr:response regulator [Calothrix sp. MO_167.B12]